MDLLFPIILINLINKNKGGRDLYPSSLILKKTKMPAGRFLNLTNIKLNVIFETEVN